MCVCLPFVTVTIPMHSMIWLAIAIAIVLVMVVSLCSEREQRPAAALNSSLVVLSAFSKRFHMETFFRNHSARILCAKGK
jgi:Mn2+/Fe2+ NRAMP family transporter